MIISFLRPIAQDRYFGQTYTTNVLPKGNIDFELWHTSRIGHSDQYFHGMEQRMEFEFGLGKNIQTAFYFNRYQTSYSNAMDEIVQNNEIGFSNEWKWKITDPSSNKIGSALYEEIGIKGDELELESKLILDKSFGKNLIAMNVVYELEYEAARRNGRSNFHVSHTPVTVDLGYMRNLSYYFGVGIEFRNYNEVIKGSWKNSVLYGGPTINYRSNRWFVIGNYLPQWVNLKKTQEFPNKKVLNELERMEARIIFGISF